MALFDFMVVEVPSVLTQIQKNPLTVPAKKLRTVTRGAQKRGSVKFVRSKMSKFCKKTQNFLSFLHVNKSIRNSECQICANFASKLLPQPHT